MGLEERITFSRSAAESWLATMALPGLGPGVYRASAFHDPTAFPGILLPASYDALYALALLRSPAFPRGPQAGRAASFLCGFQRRDGAFRPSGIRRKDIYYPGFEYIDLHATNYALGALDLLGEGPKVEVRLGEAYRGGRRLKAWLEARDLGKPWTEGNYLVNAASLLLRDLGEAEAGGDKRRAAACSEGLDLILRWHEAVQDPATGFWHDPAASDLLSAMAGAAHDLHIYYCLGLPVPRFEAMVDASLGLLGEGISSACLDIDVVDILANLHSYGYRQGEIEAYLERKLIQVLDFQNPDGGFADTREGLRGFDGWTAYREPQGLSNTFATFFRLATIGMAAWVLFPARRGDWEFRPGIGMGYFRPALPPGHTAPAAVPPRPTLGKGDWVPRNLPRRAGHGGDSHDPGAGGHGPLPPAILEATQRKLAAIDASSLTGPGAVLRIELAGPAGAWLHLKAGEGRLILLDTEPGAPDLVLGLSSRDYLRLLEGRLNALGAYMTGRLRVKGDLGLALRIQALFS